MILAIDTSSKSASCALLDGDDVIAESFCNAGVTHSATLMPMVEGLFTATGRKTDEIEMFAATSGPGSFTGVRIGASILLGLAFGKGLPCVGVSALEATALPFESFRDVIICPVMDARRGQFYNALFRNGERLTDDRAISGEDLYAGLSDGNSPVLLCGDGHALAAPFLKDLVLVDAPRDLIYPRASNVGRLARRIREASPSGTFTDLEFKPVYLRPSQAERVMSEKKQ